MKDLLFLLLTLEISRCNLVRIRQKIAKVRTERAARLFFLILPIRSLLSGVDVAFAVAVVLA